MGKEEPGRPWCAHKIRTNAKPFLIKLGVIIIYNYPLSPRIIEYNSLYYFFFGGLLVSVLFLFDSIDSGKLL